MPDHRSFKLRWLTKKATSRLRATKACGEDRRCLVCWLLSKLPEYVFVLNASLPNRARRTGLMRFAVRRIVDFGILKQSPRRGTRRGSPRRSNVCSSMIFCKVKTIGLLELDTAKSHNPGRPRASGIERCRVCLDSRVRGNEGTSQQEIPTDCATRMRDKTYSAPSSDASMPAGLTLAGPGAGV